MKKETFIKKAAKIFKEKNWQWATMKNNCYKLEIPTEKDIDEHILNQINNFRYNPDYRNIDNVYSGRIKITKMPKKYIIELYNDFGDAIIKTKVSC